MEIRFYAAFLPKSERLVLFARSVGVRKGGLAGRTQFRQQKVSFLEEEV